MASIGHSNSTLARYRAPSSSLVWVASGLTLSLAGAALTGWFFGRPEYGRMGEAFVPMGAHAAALLMLLSVTVWLVNRGNIRSARMLNGLIFGALLVELLHNVHLLPAVLSRLLAAPLPRYSFTTQLMAINATICFLFLSACLISLTRRSASRDAAAFAFVFALLSISISSLAIYGYLVGTPSAYWWHPELQFAPNTAGLAFVLGVAVLALCWHRLVAPLSRVTDVVHILHVIGCALLIVTVVLAACFSIIPLYETLLVSMRAEARAALRANAGDAAELIMRTAGAAGESGQAAYFLEVDPGSHALRISRQPRGETGAQTPPGVNIDSGALGKVLTEGLPELNAAQRVELIWRNGDGAVLAVRPVSKGERLLIVQTRIADEDPHVFDAHAGTGAHTGRARLSITEPLPGLTGQLRFSADVSPFRSVTGAQLFKVLIGLAALVAASSSLVFFLMLRLAQRIETLDGQLRESIAYANEELALRKQAQADVEKSLNEKELLLREVHHRVKNNLQIISSMINLQLRRTSNKETADTLLESANRIQSIALLHDSLYQSNDFTGVMLSDYLSDLTRYLVASSSAGRAVEVQIDTGSTVFDIDRLIPLGLLVTELVINSIKSGSSADGGNVPLKIEITAVRIAPGDLVVTYADNGAGLPAELDLEDMSLLGSRLVSTLVRQLNGRIAIVPGAGARFRIVIPVKRRYTHPLTDGENGNEQTANSNY